MFSIPILAARRPFFQKNISKTGHFRERENRKSVTCIYLQDKKKFKKIIFEAFDLPPPGGENRGLAENGFSQVITVQRLATRAKSSRKGRGLGNWG
jgi:hypothetical protein